MNTSSQNSTQFKISGTLGLETVCLCYWEILMGNPKHSGVLKTLTVTWIQILLKPVHPADRTTFLAKRVKRPPECRK